MKTTKAERVERERKRKDYFERRWLAQRIVDKKISASEEKIEGLKEEFPYIFNQKKIKQETEKLVNEAKKAGLNNLQDLTPREIIMLGK
jgi:hypothetical protein